MRLLNTKSFEFQEFFDADVPKYAILSHRWESDNDGKTEEVSHEEFVASKRRNCRGFQKIKKFCGRAKNNNFDWVWVDTCCIDRRSSAEMSEAINSMFKWYQQSDICYAYLSDVTGMHDFEQSQWFTRGWTLQELLAPEDVIFLDRTWRSLGTRQSLGPKIACATGIDLAYLAPPNHDRTQRPQSYAIRLAPVALRMSWASKRRTSRAEDMAYCLLGLFGINMSLLYGEGGHAAFRRLQIEIMVRSDDESIFAWTKGATWIPGVLAYSPEAFDGCGKFKPLDDADPGHEALARREPYQITNKGLRMEVHLLELPRLLGVIGQTYAIPINCKIHNPTKPSCPLLVPVYTQNQQTWFRGGNLIELTDIQWQELLLSHAEKHYDPVLLREKCIMRKCVQPMCLAQPLESHDLRLEECPIQKLYLNIWFNPLEEGTTCLSQRTRWPD